MLSSSAKARDIMVYFLHRLIVLLALAVQAAQATVVLYTSYNHSISFPDIEATFAPSVPSNGVMGIVYGADPLNACTTLSQTKEQNGTSAFVLVERGECDFVTKVRHAEDAGYTAAIVYDDEDGQDLVTMSGSGNDINIFAVFVSKDAGEALQLFAGDMNSTCELFPVYDSAARSVMALAFISILTIFAVLSTIFFVRRHRVHLITSGIFRRQFRGMTSKELKALAIIFYDSEVATNIETCAICLEEYRDGEKLRFLPCGHGFHVSCIDQWLTTRWSFCPICKQDARSKKVAEPPSEKTPLLAPCATQFNSMVSPIPVSAQTSQNRSPCQSSDHSADLFTRIPQTAQHNLSCLVPQFSGKEDDLSCSCSHANAMSANSSVSHSECVSSSVDACQTSSDEDHLAHGMDEEVISHIARLS